MCNIGDRHVIFKMQQVKPVDIPVEDPGSEPTCAKQLSVFLDLGRPPSEFRVLFEQVAIMIEVMNINFKPAHANILEKGLRNFVTAFGNNLERRFDAE